MKEVCRLSVNINKVATLRNARGGNNPDVVKFALDCESFGAQGITVHPRPDERHIRYADVLELSKVLKTEFNIEGNPRESKFVDLVLKAQPAQVTLVPDAENQLTSNHGWDTIQHQVYLQSIISEFQQAGIRVSIFVDPQSSMIHAAKDTGTDRIELYTESYAKGFKSDAAQAVAAFKNCGLIAAELGLGLNAGHDLDLQNLGFFAKSIPNLQEVSIGHALISDSLYFGIENTIQMYLQQLNL